MQSSPSRARNSRLTVRRSPSGDEGSRLGSEKRRLVSASLSANTRRAYDGALTRLDQAAAGHEITDGFVAGYLSALYAAGKSPATCGQVLAAIRFRARLQGTESPMGPETERVLAGVRRQGRARGRGQARGVSFTEAVAVATLASDDGDLRGLRDAALIETMSDGLLRVGEAASLRISDLACKRGGSGRLTLRHSKADPEGRGAELYLGPPTVARIKVWLRESGIKGGPLFRRLHRGGSVGAATLSTVSIRNIIKSRCARAGIQGKISGHSLRVGGAQSLAAGGASLVEMQLAGRWISASMPCHYSRGQLAGRGAVARIKYGWNETGRQRPPFTR